MGEVAEGVVDVFGGDAAGGGAGEGGDAAQGVCMVEEGFEGGVAVGVVPDGEGLVHARAVGVACGEPGFVCVVCGVERGAEVQARVVAVVGELLSDAGIAHGGDAF